MSIVDRMPRLKWSFFDAIAIGLLVTDESFPVQSIQVFIDASSDSFWFSIGRPLHRIEEAVSMIFMVSRRIELLRYWWLMPSFVVCVRVLS